MAGQPGGKLCQFPIQKLEITNKRTKTVQQNDFSGNIAIIIAAPDIPVLVRQWKKYLVWIQ